MVVVGGAANGCADDGGVLLLLVGVVVVLMVFLACSKVSHTPEVHSAERTIIWSRDMANRSSKRQETGGGASQMAEEDIACLMEG